MDNAGFFFLAFGTESTGSNFSCLGFSINTTGRVFTITTGTISSSAVSTFQNIGLANVLGTYYHTHEIEFKSNIIGTGSNHLTFRDNVYSTAEPRINSNIQVINSRTIFPNINQFLSATHGQVLNRLYFGFTSLSYTDTADVRVEAIRIKKHIMDWE